MTTDNITYIEKRMDEIGSKEFHLQPMRIEVESGISLQKIAAYNEYLFLISKTLPQDIIIQSDNNIFCSSVHQLDNLPPYEFTGMVTIESSSSEPFVIDFIRVIPK